MNICKEKDAPCIFAQASGYCCSTVCLGRIEKRPTIEPKCKRIKGLPYQKTVPKMPPCKEPKRGRWINFTSTDWSGGGATKCSCCGYGYSWREFFEVENFNYCPNCGARMEKEE